MRTRPLHTLAALTALVAGTTLAAAIGSGRTADGSRGTDTAAGGRSARPANVSPARPADSSPAGFLALNAAHAAVPEGLLPTWEPELARSPALPLTPTPAQDAQPIYLVYYWRARPGKTADYSAYIHEVAEPIDEAGRQAGAFEWVQTYTPAIQTGAPGADWTHIRIFKLSSFAAWDDFSEKLDAAGARVFTPEQRAAQRERAAPLRDLVRQEVWRAF